MCWRSYCHFKSKFTSCCRFLDPRYEKKTGCYVDPDYSLLELATVRRLGYKYLPKVKLQSTGEYGVSELGLVLADLS